MMKQWRLGLAAVFAVALVACGQSTQTSEPSISDAPAVDEVADGAVHAPLPPVDASLVGAPSSQFTAIEPSEVQIFAASTVMESLEPLLGVENQEGGESLHLTLTEAADATVADIVRTGIPDDSVSGGHIRVEYRREADGWYPTNAYRRVQCGRGAEAGQWTTGLCP